MAQGSFNGLYTFKDVAKIYNLDSSTLRKQVAANKLTVGKEVQKFGEVWLITEQAMIKHFGSGMFELYNHELNLQKIQEERELKVAQKIEKAKNTGKKKSYDMSSESKIQKGEVNNYNDTGEGLEVVSSFQF